jgi:hypothetical protein
MRPPLLRALLCAAAAACLLRHAAAAGCYLAASPQDFPHCVLLAPSFALHWRLLPADGSIRFALHVDGRPGWIGGRCAARRASRCRAARNLHQLHANAAAPAARWQAWACPRAAA